MTISGSAYEVLRVNADGDAIEFGPVNLGSTSAVAGALSVANGGTGATSPGAAAANNIGALAIANNLSDVGDPSQARTNLGLGTAALKNSSGSGPTVASVTGSFLVGHVATFADANGTIQDGGLPFDDGGRYIALHDALAFRRIVGTQGGMGLPNGAVDAYQTNTIGGTSTNAVYDPTNKLYSNGSSSSLGTMAQAQTTSAQISNYTYSNPCGFTFTTGTVPFMVTSVDLAMTGISVAGICTAGIGTGAGTGQLGSSNSVPLSSPTTTWTFSSPVTLQANTTYWFWVYFNNGANGTASLCAPGSGTGSIVSYNVQTGSNQNATVLPSYPVSGATFRVSVNGTSTADMTLSGSSLTAQAMPTVGWFTALVQRVDSAAYGTDFTVELTCDNGAHWDAVPILNLGSYDGVYDIIAGRVQFTGGGASLNYRMKSLNLKRFNVKGFSMAWQ